MMLGAIDAVLTASFWLTHALQLRVSILVRPRQTLFCNVVVQFRGPLPFPSSDGRKAQITPFSPFAKRGAPRGDQGRLNLSVGPRPCVSLTNAFTLYPSDHLLFNRIHLIRGEGGAPHARINLPEVPVIRHPWTYVPHLTN